MITTPQLIGFALMIVGVAFFALAVMISRINRRARAGFAPRHAYYMNRYGAITVRCIKVPLRNEEAIQCRLGAGHGGTCLIDAEQVRRAGYVTPPL